MSEIQELLDYNTEKNSALVSVELERLKKELNAKSWTTDIEDLVKSLGEKAAYNKDLHSSASRYWKSIGDRLLIPILILNTIGGVANFGAANVNQPSYWMYSIGVMNLFAAGLGSINQYLKPTEKCEKHFHIARTFGSFYRTVMIELGIGRHERANSDEILRLAKNEYDRVQLDSPLLPLKVIERFKCVHKDQDKNLPDCVSDSVTIHINR